MITFKIEGSIFGVLNFFRNGTRISVKNLQKHFEAGDYLSKQCYRGRFAPSPTGALHLGNLRTALVSWLRARIQEGSWFLRIDDLDTPRNRLGSIESIQADLSWLGLKWDGPIIFQSQRKRIYNSVLTYFLKQNRLFACECSRKRLKNLSKGIFSGSFYDGTCRHLGLPLDTDSDHLRSWRLIVNKKFSKVSGDIIVRRSDGYIAYHLATVIDDLMLGINEVVRGYDLASAEQSQFAIIDVLKQRFPVYKYIPLVLDCNGRKLSKRHGGISLNYCKDKGMDSSQVIGLLSSSLGLVPFDSELSCDELLADLKKNSYTFDKVFNDTALNNEVII